MEKTNEDFEKVIANFSIEIKVIASTTRQLIYDLMPKVVEVVWLQQKNIGFGTGIKKNTAHFCYIMPASKHVNLGFNYGSELPDPHGLLEGTGKLFRHIKIKSVEQLKDKNLIELLKFSMNHRVPKIE